MAAILEDQQNSFLSECLRNYCRLQSPDGKNDKQARLVAENLNRDFDAELEELQDQFKPYLKSVGKYSPGARSQRLQLIEAAKKALTENPSEGNLAAYKKAVTVKIPKAEQIVFDALKAGLVGEEDIADDVAVIQEVLDLRKQLAGDAISKADAESAKLSEKLAALMEKLNIEGVQAGASESYQRLHREYMNIAQYHRELVLMQIKLDRLECYQIVIGLNGQK
ncbi:hypothetical protein ACFL02_02075 [Planctomycetota bacterium]